MALTAQQRDEKIVRMLEQHETLRRVALNHINRLAITLETLDGLSDELDMHAQHRAVTPDRREEVSVALHAVGPVYDQISQQIARLLPNAPDIPVDPVEESATAEAERISARAAADSRTLTPVRG